MIATEKSNTQSINAVLLGAAKGVDVRWTIFISALHKKLTPAASGFKIGITPSAAILWITRGVPRREPIVELNEDIYRPVRNKNPVSEIFSAIRESQRR